MSKMMLIAILALPFAFAMPATQAQTIEGAAYITPITDNVQPLLYGATFSKEYLERAAKGENSRASSKPMADDGRLAVKFDPDVSRAVREEYIAAIERTSGAKAARGLDDYYEANDVHALLRKAVAPYGLRVDDLGDVTTAWLVVMWMTANQAPLPAVEAVQGVREQTRAAMIDGRRVPAKAEKQRMLEALAYQTVTLIRVRESAQEGGNEDFLAQLSDSAQATMQRQDLDLRAMALTEDGLVRR